VTETQPTKKDRIVEELRRLVETGEIARGSRLGQDELAERFDASITPVREALRQLEAEGLLESEARRGVRVAMVDLEQLKATYIARRLVEPYVTARAALRVSRHDIAEIRRTIVEMAEAGDRGDNEGMKSANREFHFRLYERCGIPSLTRHVERLWLSWPWDVLEDLQSGVKLSVPEHEAIVAAIEVGDLDEVARASEVHLTRHYMILVRQVSGSSDVADPFDVNVD
jgi:DNA-binding GntR family transcriptional regulator